MIGLAIREVCLSAIARIDSVVLVNAAVHFVGSWHIAAEPYVRVHGSFRSAADVARAQIVDPL
jgi:hypothetical protein